MLRSKTAIITGADQGLGKYTARLFIQYGASVVICSRNLKLLEEVAEELNSEKLFFFQADISNCIDVDRLFDFALSKLGTLDIVVNNAAIQGPIGRFDETIWDDWRNVLEVNLFGSAYCMKKAIEIFRKQGCKGKIINLSGGGATSSRPNFSGYAVAKCGLVRLTEILADENREYGIDINSVAPGVMKTGMLQTILDAGRDCAGELEFDKAYRSLNEDDTSMVEPAELVVFLASNKSNGLSGKLISAMWDAWSQDDFISKCTDENIFTLRRVVN